MTSFPEQRLKMLEESAFKEKREIETRQNAEDLHRYLDFADIDWKNVKTSDFEVVNFSGKTTLVKTADEGYYFNLHIDDERLSRKYRNLNNFGSRGFSHQVHSLRHDFHQVAQDTARQF